MMKRRIKKRLLLAVSLVAFFLVCITYLENTENNERKQGYRQTNNPEKYDIKERGTHSKGDFMYINGVARFVKPFRIKTSVSFDQDAIREKSRFISRCRQWLKDSTSKQKKNSKDVNIEGTEIPNNNSSKTKKCTDISNTNPTKLVKNEKLNLNESVSFK